jgi:hypothetical protein
MQATICLLSERKEENSFLTSPLIGLIQLDQERKVGFSSVKFSLPGETY